MKRLLYVLTVFCIVFMASAAAFAAQEDAACRSMTPALVGGPVAHSSDLLTMRYLGAANMELTYKNQVILLSTYYVQPTVINPADVKRADAIFMGHEDGDHMQHAVQVSNQTGASLYGNANVINKALAGGLPADKAVQLKSGDVVNFDGFTVEAVMMCHSGSNAPEGPYGPNCYQSRALSYYGQAAKGTDLGGTCFLPCDTTPKFGTCRQILAYLFTFGKDFRLLFYDSAATLVSDDIKALMERIGGSVDVGTVAHAGGHSITQVPYTMVPIKVMNPRLFIPNHHLGMNYQMVAEDLFQAIRDEMPDTEGLSLLYKEPLCFNVKSHIATKVSPLGSVWSYDMK
jgi:hypothetical protein